MVNDGPGGRHVSEIIGFHKLLASAAGYQIRNNILEFEPILEPSGRGSRVKAYQKRFCGVVGTHGKPKFYKHS